MILISMVSLAGILFLFFKVEIIAGLDIWNYIVFLIQATFGLIIAWKYLKGRKYFIELNQDEINFHIPKVKIPVNIKLIEIQSLTVLDDKIELFLIDNKTETINLNYFYLPLKDDIRQYFMEVKSRVKT